MMAPGNATPAGHLGLVFFGTTVAGHEAIGHDGQTLAFFSGLTIFPGQDLGIFVSRDGTGEIKPFTDAFVPAHPAQSIAQRFLVVSPETSDARAAPFPDNAGIAGTYHPSRRIESAWPRLGEFGSQRVVRVDGDGNMRWFFAVWPFGHGRTFRRV